jgi:hypothetical protein
MGEKELTIPPAQPGALERESFKAAGGMTRITMPKAYDAIVRDRKATSTRVSVMFFPSAVLQVTEFLYLAILWLASRD